MSEPIFYADAAALERPDFVVESSWLGHVPFAQWATARMRPARVVELGTHNGASFLGFAQGARRVAREDRPVHVTAVDHWQGDEQAGFYGEAVHDLLKSRLQTRFTSGPGLTVDMWRMTFDEALDDVEDGTVDLLHVDGLHTYEAVSHDFHSWLPKLGPRGVVLLHDTEVTMPGFGVRRFFDELARHYPTMSFRHSHGLGVVKVGDSREPWLERLLDHEPDDAGLEPRVTFERLGEAVALRSHLGRASERLDALAELARRTALFQRDQIATLGRGTSVEIVDPKPPVEPEIERAILDSGLFDADHYAAQIGIASRDPAVQLRHYLEWGEAAGLTPSLCFDPSIYRANYRDLVDVPINMLEHYVRHGRHERRFAQPSFPEQRLPLPQENEHFVGPRTRDVLKRMEVAAAREGTRDEAAAGADEIDGREAQLMAS